MDIFSNKLSTNKKSSSFFGSKIEKKKNSSINSSHHTNSFKSSLVNQILETEFQGDIDNFILELDTLQEKMISKPSLALVEEYRQKIGFFLDKMLSHYQGQSYFRGGYSNRIEMKIWHSINEELEIISQKIISNNTPGFQLLKNLGTIKGLVLDIKIGKI